MEIEMAYCSVSISPMRKSASDCSEMVSQLFFGETVEILEKEDQWRKVKSSHDDYIGWLDEKCISQLTEKEAKAWSAIKMPLFNATLILNSIEGELFLTKGAFVSSQSNPFYIGRNKYHSSDSFEKLPSTILKIAKSYQNAPYLWGGKSLFGIDCSGFTQMVFRFLSISLPRDASQQSEIGTEINYNERKIGDLVFFKNANGNIHHVGIVLEKDQVIHAHGWLRIDNMDEIGILGRAESKYSHKMASIKRILHK